MSIPSRYSRKERSALCLNVRPDLTFGIELELLVVIHQEHFKSTLTAHERRMLASRNIDDFQVIVRKRLYNLLRDKVAVHEPLRKIKARQELKRDYSKWDLTTDDLHLLPSEQSVLDESQGFNVAELEIISRKFRYRKDDWQTEILHVCRAIQALNDGVHCCVITNRQTGLHVHVGLEGGLPRRAVKNVMLVSAGFERLFDRLHPASRVRSSNPWCRPLSFLWRQGHFRAGLIASDDVPGWTDLQLHLDAIGSLRRRERLCSVYVRAARDATARPRDAVVNFGNLTLWDGHTTRTNEIGQAYPKIETIEFRQHRSTVDLVEIVNWVQVLARIVSAAADDAHSDDKNSRLIRNLANDWSTDPSFSLRDFLEAFALHPNIVGFYADRWEEGDARETPRDDGDDGPLADLIRLNEAEKARDGGAGEVAAAINEKVLRDFYGLKPVDVEMEDAEEGGWEGSGEYIISL